jgi:hypothetical protein
MILCSSSLSDQEDSKFAPLRGLYRQTRRAPEFSDPDSDRSGRRFVAANSRAARATISLEKLQNAGSHLPGNQ